MIFVSLQASADSVMDASAVQFCARKVSAVSGDARKALDICRYVTDWGRFTLEETATSEKGGKSVNAIMLKIHAKRWNRKRKNSKFSFFLVSAPQLILYNFIFCWCFIRNCSHTLCKCDYDYVTIKLHLIVEHFMI